MRLAYLACSQQQQQPQPQQQQPPPQPQPQQPQPQQQLEQKLVVPRMIGGSDVLGMMGTAPVKQEPLDDMDMDSDTCGVLQDTPQSINVLGDTIWPQDDCNSSGLFESSPFVEQQFDPSSSERGATDVQETDIGLIDGSDQHWDDFWKL